jgi:hypothetical protein
LGADTGCKGATSNGNDCSLREYCLHRKIYFCEARDVRGRLTLMRQEKKGDKIEVAEGLSQ